MARLTVFLLFSAIVLTFVKFSSHSNFSPYLNLVSVFADSKLFKTLFVAIFVVFIIYFIVEQLGSSSEEENSKFYADQISSDEYEAQKRSYTQKKLAELFNTKEYQDYIRFKSLNMTPKHQITEGSDEEM
jgi:hypothetical protein